MLAGQFSPIIPYADNFYKTFGAYSAIDVNDFESYTSLKPFPNYQFSLSAMKRFKNLGLSSSLSYTGIGYSVDGNQAIYRYRFSDQIDPDRGFVNPTYLNITETEVKQDLMMLSLGANVFLKRRRFTFEFGTDLGYQYLLNCRIRMFTNGGRVLETPLNTSEFAKGSFFLSTHEKITYLVNRNLDVVIGLQQQLAFNTPTDIYQTKQKGYEDDGFSRLMLTFGLRYFVKSR